MPIIDDSARAALHDAAKNLDLPEVIRKEALLWVHADKDLTAAVLRADAVLEWPEGRHGLDRAACNVAAHEALRGGDAGATIRALENATIDTLARARTLAIVITFLETRANEAKK